MMELQHIENYAEIVKGIKKVLSTEDFVYADTTIIKSRREANIIAHDLNLQVLYNETDDRFYFTSKLTCFEDLKTCLN